MVETPDGKEDGDGGENDRQIAEDRARLRDDEARERDDEARVEDDKERIEEDKHEIARDQAGSKVKLRIVVNGDEVKVEAAPQELLQAVVEKALEESKNVGRPLQDWELRNEAGDLLELTRTVDSYGLKSGALLSLTLKAGVAG